jgi:ribosome-associated protein YbcJ (S4-like RNA binding protein)
MTENIIKWLSPSFMSGADARSYVSSSKVCVSGKVATRTTMVKVGDTVVIPNRLSVKQLAHARVSV